MFSEIKEKRRQKALEGWQNTQTVFSSLEGLRSATVILDCRESSYDDCNKEILKYLNSRGIRGKFFYIDLKKYEKDELPITSHDRTLLRSDLDWADIPHGERMDIVLSDPTDVLICLMDSDCFPLEFVIKRSCSHFKIGRHQFDGDPFDIVFEDPAGKKLNQLESFIAISKYLNKF